MVAEVAEEHARRLRLSVEQVLAMSEVELSRAYKTTKVVGDTEEQQLEWMRRDLNERWAGWRRQRRRQVYAVRGRSRGALHVLTVPRGRMQRGRCEHRPAGRTRSSSSSRTSSTDPGDSDGPSSSYRCPAESGLSFVRRRELHAGWPLLRLPDVFRRWFGREECIRAVVK